MDTLMVVNILTGCIQKSAFEMSTVIKGIGAPNITSS